MIKLTLTAAGEAAAAQVPQVLAEVNNAYLRGLDRGEWQQLLQLLRRMLANGPTGPRATGPQGPRELSRPRGPRELGRPHGSHEPSKPAEPRRAPRKAPAAARGARQAAR